VARVLFGGVLLRDVLGWSAAPLGWRAVGARDNLQLLLVFSVLIRAVKLLLEAWLRCGSLPFDAKDRRAALCFCRSPVRTSLICSALIGTVLFAGLHVHLCDNRPRTKSVYQGRVS